MSLIFKIKPKIVKLSQHFNGRINGIIFFLSEFKQLLLIFGCLVSIYYFQYKGLIIVIISLLFLTLTIFRLGFRRFLPFILIILLGVLLGFGRIIVDKSVENELISEWEPYIGRADQYEVYIQEEPKYDHEEVKVTYILNAVSHSNDMELPKIKILSKSSRYPYPEIGKLCIAKGILKTPQNYGDFDYVGYLKSKKIYFLIDVKEIDCREEYKISLVERALYFFKRGVVSQIEKNLHEPYASLMLGILLGDDRVFYDQFEDGLKVTGTTHIIAASGYNVTLIANSVDRILGKILKPLYRGFFSILFIWSFAFIAGFSASIVRASLMTSIMLIASLSGRVKNIHFVLPYTVFIFLIIDPRVISSISFQLSVLSTASLIYLMPISLALVDSLCMHTKMAKSKIFTIFKGFLEDLFLPTLCCTLGTAAIIISTFGEISLIGLLSNSLILPLVEIIMIEGLLALLIGALPLSLEKVIYYLAFLKLYYFESVVKHLGDIDWAVLKFNNEGSHLIGLLLFSIVSLIVVLAFPLDRENYYFSKSQI